MSIEIKKSECGFYQNYTIALDAEILGHANSIFVSPDEIQICLSDWYGRRDPDVAIAAIDDLITLLQAAKAEIVHQQSAVG